MKKLPLLLITVLFVLSINAQEENLHSHASSRRIEFPNIKDFKTLICDFHQHTVFSDGNVWPNIRVQEALKDGLDVISVTEHLEYQPHKNDIPHPDRNRSFQIALQEAKNHNLIVVNGSEITRSMPPGHSNAIFITDANLLVAKDSLTPFIEAKKQKAFTFWNHPNWTAQVKSGIAKLTPTHTYLLKNKLLHGIEVVNEKTYSEEALQIAIDHNLTILGNSDIHGLVDWLFEVPNGGHRPVTLVFAKEKTAQSVKKALFDGRTLVYYNNLLIGKGNNFLLPLIKASLHIEKALYMGKSSVLSISIRNTSDVDYMLKNKTKYTFHNQGDVIVLKSHQNTEIQVKVVEKLAIVDLKFEVLNAISAPKVHPKITFTIKAENLAK